MDPGLRRDDDQGNALERRHPVYVFRDSRFARDGGTVVSAAPRDLVVAVYGGGGRHDEGGLSAIFGGAAFFRNDETGSCYLGVWGARKASRFRSRLRSAGVALEFLRKAPPARLIFFETNSRQ